jgi:cobalamin biosynthesis protein CobD/CbiB
VVVSQCCNALFRVVDTPMQYHCCNSRCSGALLVSVLVLASVFVLVLLEIMYPSPYVTPYVLIMIAPNVLLATKSFVPSSLIVEEGL